MMETVNDGGDAECGDGVGVCLICHSRDLRLSTQNETTSFAKKSFTSTVLSKHLSVYFLLRHVLELPSEQLETYLRDFPNPENWVKICSSCDKNYVKTCWRIFEELLEVKRRFVGAKLDLIQAVKKSLDEELPQNVREDNEFILDIDFETRRFVGEREYVQRSEIRTSTNEDSVSSKRSEAVETGSPKSDTIANRILFLNENEMKPITALKPAGSFGTNLEECEIKEEPTSPIADAGRMTTKTADESSWEHNDEFYDESSLPGDSSLSESESDDDSIGNDWNPDEDISVSSDDGLKEVVPVPILPKVVSDPIVPIPLECHRGQDSQQQLVRCPLCKSVASSRDALFQHISSCQDDQIVNLKCDHCEDKFISKPVYLNHLGFAHGIMDHLQFQCHIPGCGRAFSRKDFRTKHSSEMHIRRPAVPPEGLICKVCGKLFKLWPYFEKHMELHELHGKDLFQCKICGKNFSQSNHLRRHIKDIHSQCSKCDWKASSSDPLNIRAHMISHHGTQEKMKTLKTFTCPKCEKKFCYRSMLHVHLSSCQNRSVCEHCGKEFPSESSMFNHLGAVHGIKDNLKFQCPVEACGKWFHRKRDLSKHSVLHKKPKHECSVCGIKFKRKDLLNRHMLCHRAKKAYQCDLCPASFARKDHLLKHMRTGIHSQNGRQGKRTYYECFECQLRFGLKSQLEGHLEKMHGGKETVISFREADEQAESLKNENKNKPEKKFQCEDCGKIFNHRKNLNAHKKRIHSRTGGDKEETGEKGSGKI